MAGMYIFGSGGGAAFLPPAAAAAPPGPWAAAGCGADARDVDPPEWWDALKAAEAAVWGVCASLALAARDPEDGPNPSLPSTPSLPPGAWAVIMDNADSCRCARAGVRGSCPT